MYKAVIFDLDGTLLNTLDDLAGAVNYALKTCGYPLHTKEDVRRFIGNGVVKLMQRATPENISKPDFDRCFELFRTYYLEHMADNTKPYSGIKELLSLLKEHGIKSAVVSNKLHAGVVGLCKDYFEDDITCAFGVENESERKPSPANVNKALKALGITKDEAIYVGDSEVDVMTANNSGLDCIGVTWGFRDRNELVENGAKYIVDAPSEILDIVLK